MELQDQVSHLGSDSGAVGTVVSLVGGRGHDCQESSCSKEGQEWHTGLELLVVCRQLLLDGYQ